jgi:hypothetical protein
MYSTCCLYGAGCNGFDAGKSILEEVGPENRDFFGPEMREGFSLYQDSFWEAVKFLWGNIQSLPESYSISLKCTNLL